MRLRKCASSSIFRMLSISRLCVDSWMLWPALSSTGWSTRKKLPSRHSTMAWKISLTWWVTHLKRSCACSKPRSTSARPTLEGGCSRSTSSSWAALHVAQADEHLAEPVRRHRREVAPRTSPSRSITERSPPGACTRMTPLQRDWLRKAMRSESGKPPASPASTTRGAWAGSRPRRACARRRAGPAAVGIRAYVPVRPAERRRLPLALRSGTSCPEPSMRKRALIRAPSVGGPGVVVRAPLELVLQRCGRAGPR